jgi:hypothetical protein
MLTRSIPACSALLFVCSSIRCAASFCGQPSSRSFLDNPFQHRRKFTSTAMMGMRGGDASHEADQDMSLRVMKLSPSARIPGVKSFFPTRTQILKPFTYAQSSENHMISAFSISCKKTFRNACSNTPCQESLASFSLPWALISVYSLPFFFFEPS